MTTTQKTAAETANADTTGGTHTGASPAGPAQPASSPRFTNVRVNATGAGVQQASQTFLTTS
jgi:hypothetical protein